MNQRNHIFCTPLSQRIYIFCALLNDNVGSVGILYIENMVVLIAITNVHSNQQDCIVQNSGESDTQGEQAVMTALL